MNRVQWIELLLTGGDKPHIKGVVYSREEAERILSGEGRNNITGITWSDDLGNEAEFFTNNHLFGYPHLGDDFCPCSMSTPMSCVPRPGCEDGIINSVDKYLAVHKRALMIWSMDELIDFLAQRGMVDGEPRKLKPFPTGKKAAR